jgi:hypothetical protein
MEEKDETLTGTASDKGGQTDRIERSDFTDGGEKHSAETGEPDIPRPSGPTPGRLRALLTSRKKPIIIGLLGLVSIAVGLSRTLGLNGGVPGLGLRPPMSDSSGEPRDYYVEESLSPFFVPLPATSSERVAIIDFTVVWDGRASVRFRRKELQIRASLYRHILERAKKGEDLQEKTPILEAEMSRTFQESMGNKEIAIRIKRVKVL